MEFSGLIKEGILDKVSHVLNKGRHAELGLELSLLKISILALGPADLLFLLRVVVGTFSVDAVFLFLAQ